MDNLKRFVQDDGETMRNKLGIWRNPDAFERALSAFSGERISELRENPDLIAPTFDRRHLAALHKHILQDVFEWAGKMRDETVRIEGERIGPVKTMAKGGGEQFDEAKSLKKGFGVLGKIVDLEAARKMDHGSFADHAAQIFTHINWMHPFREGNGRVQREFISQYAESAGHSLDFRFTTQARVYDASARSTRGQHSHMRRFFEEVSDPACVARMRGPYDAFSGVDGFQKLYFAHAHPGRPVRGMLRGAGQDEFVVQDPKTTDITIAAKADMPKDAQRGAPVDFIPKTRIGPARPDTSQARESRE